MRPSGKDDVVGFNGRLQLIVASLCQSALFLFGAGRHWYVYGNLASATHYNMTAC